MAWSTTRPWSPNICTSTPKVCYSQCNCIIVIQYIIVQLNHHCHRPSFISSCHLNFSHGFTLMPSLAWRTNITNISHLLTVLPTPLNLSWFWINYLQIAVNLSYAPYCTQHILLSFSWPFLEQVFTMHWCSTLDTRHRLHSHFQSLPSLVAIM